MEDEAAANPQEVPPLVTSPTSVEQAEEEESLRVAKWFSEASSGWPGKGTIVIRARVIRKETLARDYLRQLFDSLGADTAHTIGFEQLRTVLDGLGVRQHIPLSPHHVFVRRLARRLLWASLCLSH